MSDIIKKINESNNVKQGYPVVYTGFGLYQNITPAIVSATSPSGLYQKLNDRLDDYGYYS